MNGKQIKSIVTGKEYDPSKCVRIVNITQIAAYIENNIELLDIFPSKDNETGKRILVAVFDKEDSFEAYKAWCNHEL